jgi:hypothetical protein
MNISARFHFKLYMFNDKLEENISIIYCDIDIHELSSKTSLLLSLFSWRFIFLKNMYIWAASRQNQHNAFATSMHPDQPVYPRSLIRIHAVRLQTLLQVVKLIANSMNHDQTANGCAGWSGSMLVANALCWFCRDAAHISVDETQCVKTKQFCYFNDTMAAFISRVWHKDLN